MMPRSVQRGKSDYIVQPSSLSYKERSRLALRSSELLSLYVASTYRA